MAEITYSGLALKGMENISVDTAIAYINNEEEARKFLRKHTTFDSWIKDAKKIDGHKVIKAKFRVTTFSSTEMGTYDNVKGYPDAGYNTTWIEKELTQDKGDVLTVDKITDEASLGGDIVALYNNYSIKVKIPTMEKYVYGKVVKEATAGKTETLTKENFFQAILSAQTYFEEEGYELTGLELRISPAAKQLLIEQGFDKGVFAVSGQGYSFTNDLNSLGNNIRALTVPQKYLGKGINFILAPVEAVSVVPLLDETVYHAPGTIPGHGKRKATVDVGVFYDAFVGVGFENYVYVSKTSDASVVSGKNTDKAVAPATK